LQKVLKTSQLNPAIKADLDTLRAVPQKRKWAAEIFHINPADIAILVNNPTCSASVANARRIDEQWEGRMKKVSQKNDLSNLRYTQAYEVLMKRYNEVRKC
jgi:hypothetical protein